MGSRSRWRAVEAVRPEDPEPDPGGLCVRLEMVPSLPGVNPEVAAHLVNTDKRAPWSRAVACEIDEHLAAVEVAADEVADDSVGEALEVPLESWARRRTRGRLASRGSGSSCGTSCPEVDEGHGGDDLVSEVDDVPGHLSLGDRVTARPGIRQVGWCLRKVMQADLFSMAEILTFETSTSRGGKGTSRTRVSRRY